jgi:4-hydroxyphenylpyruvate dioxygenase-like putative hemolysin
MANTQPRIKLGPLSHIGIVVEDMDQAIDYYERVFGLGPFQTEVYDLSQFTHKSKPINAKVKAGIAYAGSVFVELVQVLEGETPHSEFLRQRGEGLQHVAFSVEDIDSALAELAKEGIEPLMSYTLTIEAPGNEKDGSPTTRRRFDIHEAYLDSTSVGGTIIQLLEIKERGSR